MDRKLNTLFTFVLVVVFITAASTIQQWHIILGLFLALVFSFGAFLFRRLTLDGIFAAIVMGTFIFGLGGWGAAAVVLLFFISSAIVSGQWKVQSADLPNGARRNGLQVWANGFWLVVFLIVAVIFDEELFLVGAMAVIATATADTWATELGSDALNATYLITNFDIVEPGTDGGISLKGTSAALFGSVMIAALSMYVFSFPFYVFWCIFGAGFLGCLIDSYLGAIFQRNNSSVMWSIPEVEISIDNDIVNAISTGAGAVLAIILKLLLA